MTPHELDLHTRSTNEYNHGANGINNYSQDPYLQGNQISGTGAGFSSGVAGVGSHLSERKGSHLPGPFKE